MNNNKLIRKKKCICTLQVCMCGSYLSPTPTTPSPPMLVSLRLRSLLVETLLVEDLLLWSLLVETLLVEDLLVGEVLTEPHPVLHTSPPQRLPHGL